jgi:hypothetical protein
MIHSKAVTPNKSGLNTPSNKSNLNSPKRTTTKKNEYPLQQLIVNKVELVKKSVKVDNLI